MAKVKKAWHWSTSDENGTVTAFTRSEAKGAIKGLLGVDRTPADLDMICGGDVAFPGGSPLPVVVSPGPFDADDLARARQSLAETNRLPADLVARLTGGVDPSAEPDAAAPPPAINYPKLLGDHHRAQNLRNAMVRSGLARKPR